MEKLHADLRNSLKIFSYRDREEKCRKENFRMFQVSMWMCQRCIASNICKISPQTQNMFVAHFEKVKFHTFSAHQALNFKSDNL